MISKLNPKPGGALSSINQNTHIVPDFILTIEDGQLHVALNQRNAPQLRVSNAYKDMLSGYSVAPSKSKSQQEAVQFIKQNWMPLNGLSMRSNSVTKPSHSPSMQF